MSAKAPMAQPTTQAPNSATANHPAAQALTTPAVTAEEAQASSALPRGAGPVLDLDDLAREVRSLRRQMDALNRRLADRPAVQEALPLRKVAPLVGFSVGRLRWYMCDPAQREFFDLDSLLFRVGRRWFSTPERIAQWLDGRAKRDPRLPAGVTSIDELMDGASR